MNAPISTPATPYTLADFLAMRPGTILHGFMYLENKTWALGPVWTFRPSPFSPSRFFSHCFISEHEVRWKQKFSRYSFKVSKSQVYKPPPEVFGETELKTSDTLNLTYDVQLPVGIYLGNILRVNGVSYVNVLSPEGYAIWI